MQSSKRKISKKDLKEDQLITFYYNSKAFLEKNSKLATGVLVGIIAVVIISVLVIRSRTQANIVAGSELYKANVEYSQNNFRQAVDQSLSLIDTYPGTRNAAEAKLLLAKAYFRMADFDSSLFYADNFLNKHAGDPILTSTAMNVKAASLEEKGEFIAAAEIYANGAAKFSNFYTAPGFLFNAGRCYYMAGDYNKAIDLLKRLIEIYPESQITTDANELLVLAGGVKQEITGRPGF